MKSNFDLIPISANEYSTLLGMNGGCPESPDGKLLVYAKKESLNNTESGNTEVWICTTNLKDHRKVFEVNCGNHNSVSATFISNNTIVFRGIINKLSCFYILDINTCKVLYGPIMAKESHCAQNNKYPFSISTGYENKNPDYPEIDGIGIYELDCTTFKIKKVLCSYELLDFIRIKGYTPNAHTVNMSHVQFNPSATQVMMRLSVEECKIFGALGCYDMITGEKFIIPDKPVHQLWFDDNTYMATYQHHNGQTIEMHSSRIKRYTRDGEVLEVLGGIGNHIDGSPDRQWFVGDRAYPGYDMDILLYKRGEIEPAAILDSHRFLKAIWDLKIHANPSFSRDGKRVYFNRPVSEDKTQAVYVDISKII